MPTFEHTELFERGVGGTTDVVEKQMYTFPDKSGRSITLRPEGTASVARSFLQHSLYAEPMPAKITANAAPKSANTKPKLFIDCFLLDFKVFQIDFERCENASAAFIEF